MFNFKFTFFIKYGILHLPSKNFKKIKSNKEKEVSLIDKKNKNKEKIKCLGKCFKKNN